MTISCFDNISARLNGKKLESIKSEWPYVHYRSFVSREMGPLERKYVSNASLVTITSVALVILVASALALAASQGHLPSLVSKLNLDHRMSLLLILGATGVAVSGIVTVVHLSFFILKNFCDYENKKQIAVEEQEVKTAYKTLDNPANWGDIAEEEYLAWMTQHPKMNNPYPNWSCEYAKWKDSHDGISYQEFLYKQAHPNEQITYNLGKDDYTQEGFYRPFGPSWAWGGMTYREYSAWNKDYPDSSYADYSTWSRANNHQSYQSYQSFKSGSSAK